MVFLIVRECVPPARLDQLRRSFATLVDRQRAIWAREREPDDPPAVCGKPRAQLRRFRD